MLLAILNLCDDEKAEKEEQLARESEQEREKNKARLKAKVKSVSKMLRMYSILVYVNWHNWFNTVVEKKERR